MPCIENLRMKPPQIRTKTTTTTKTEMKCNITLLTLPYKHTSLPLSFLMNLIIMITTIRSNNPSIASHNVVNNEKVNDQNNHHTFTISFSCRICTAIMTRFFDPLLTTEYSNIVCVLFTPINTSKQHFTLGLKILLL